MRSFAALLLAILLTSATVGIRAQGRAQATAQEPTYVLRGIRAEVRQHELKDRLDRFHDEASVVLQRDAPDLLPALETPPPIAYGYQILPRIIAEPTREPAGKPHVVSFSWPWSETLISRAMEGIDRLESDLAAASQKPVPVRHAAYAAVVADYKKAVDHRRQIDADIDYNWLWQGQIARGQAMFDRLTTQMNAEVAKLAESSASGSENRAPLIGIDPPEFVHVDTESGRVRTVTVPIDTDILDRDEVESFRRAVENYWHVFDGRDEYRVQLDIHAISPERLYCSPAGDGKAPAGGCSPPAKGEHIDLGAHVARFPVDAAVLTTGTESIQVVAARAIVLGPHDVAPRTLAHEFGHILGFPDAYLRGYKDLGVDGYQVLEFVPNYRDIMASPGAGSVLVGHFKALITAKESEALMETGLDDLYKRGDAYGAAARFREVLALNPEHYGATLQLAKALDRAGERKEALPYWKKMGDMAEAAGDAETSQTVRVRLSEPR